MRPRVCLLSFLFSFVGIRQGEVDALNTLVGAQAEQISYLRNQLYLQQRINTALSSRQVMKDVFDPAPVSPAPPYSHTDPSLLSSVEAAPPEFTRADLEEKVRVKERERALELERRRTAAIPHPVSASARRP
jgi:hypothetical protein